MDALLIAGSSSTTGTYNVGSGVETNIGNIAKYIGAMFNADVEFLNKDVIGSLRLQCDNRKIKNHLGWQPKVAFEEGIKETVTWYKQNQGVLTSTK